ncbi:MFS transporter [Actinoplanes teichomyceticus]|uniref:Transmembrane secretion effector n=1 Tax=Actinoplanes teichomyceticus TaxID=1867 RepID=A0A561VGL2_ACTTI|nr:MFS transporter [Actinoplanes teichomyceticus]TWG10747.1 transmembrane secretion effector [Actinoplanes teichomyceticus]GIF12629.1 hypothetical protein Ate01nite_26610 [Actinoplanes teichomyceticus]
MDRRPLAIPAYRRMWLASLVSAVGGSFSVVAVPVQLYATTGSSATVGLAAVVSFVALAGSALGTGALADTRDRRQVLLAAQSVLVLAHLALWAQAALGGVPLPLLLLLVAGQGSSLGAISTTSGAVLPRLVPADLLPAANSLNSLVRSTGSILGPTLAGLLIPLTGLSTLYLCDALALLAALRAVHLLPPLPPLPPSAAFHAGAPSAGGSSSSPSAPSHVGASSAGGSSSSPFHAGAQSAGGSSSSPSAPSDTAASSAAGAASSPSPPRLSSRVGASSSLSGSSPSDASSARPAASAPPGTVPGRAARSVAGQVLAGFRYLAGSRMLLAVLAVDLAAMVFGMPVALFPELAERVFGGPPGGGPTLGLLYAAYPAGVVLAGLGSAAFTRARRHGLLMAGAALAWGVTVVLFSLTTRLWLALAVLTLGGAINLVLSTFRNAISQDCADDAMRGRIQGALIVVLVGGPQLANLLHGWIGSLAGPRLTIAAGGLLTVATVAAIVRAVPELRRYSVCQPEAATGPGKPPPASRPTHPDGGAGRLGGAR